MQAMPRITSDPSAAIMVMLTDAPSSTMANSSTNLALKPMPSFQLLPGFQAVRTATPIRIASTRASR